MKKGGYYIWTGMNHPTLYEYLPNQVPHTKSLEIYEELVDAVRSLPQQDVVVYGKVYKQPRIVGYFSKNQIHFPENEFKTYVYSGATQINCGWSDTLEYLAGIAKDISGQEFDSALVNWYRDGNDNIGAHCDKDAMENPIVSFSFYEDPTQLRTLHIYDENGSRTSIVMEHGSATLMKIGMQQTHKHAVPKRKKIKTGRVNVTFRVHN